MVRQRQWWPRRGERVCERVHEKGKREMEKTNGNLKVQGSKLNAQHNSVPVCLPFGKQGT